MPHEAAYYWADTETHPAELPIHAREAWHRDAWDREQTELGNLIGHDAVEHPQTSFATGAALHPSGNVRAA